MLGRLTGDYYYRYDDEGNRVSSSQVSSKGERTTRSYRYAQAGDGNRLIEDTDSVSGLTRRYRYDDKGSPVSTGQLRYEYNNDRRPTAVYRDDELIARYYYNSFGERTKKVTFSGADTSGNTTYFLYDGTTLTAEINGNGDITSQYVYLNANRPVLKLEGDNVYSIHTDHLGTPRSMSDSDGALVWSASYSPFGEASVTTEKVSLPLRLPGQYLDAETGTHYNYLRDYDPGTGRYLTSDPIGLNGGINTYAYAGNNPISLFDVSGLKPEAEQLADGGWRINAEAYASLFALASENRRVEYYFMLHSLTGSRLAFEMAQISSNSEQVGGIAWNANYAIEAAFPDIYPTNEFGETDIQTFSEIIFAADFAAISHFQCVGPNEASYRLPSDSEMVQVTVGAWESVELGHVAPPLVRQFLDLYGDVLTQVGVGVSILPFDINVVPERYEEAFEIIADATRTEVLNANGFYEPEFIRDHPDADIETVFSADCLSKMLSAPIGSRDSSMSIDQLNLYNDVTGSPTHDIIVVQTSGAEYGSCVASQ